MTRKDIYDFFQSTDNKDFYKDWFVQVCNSISVFERRQLKEHEMESILKTFFKQVKEGGN
jgi:general stress protein 26